MEKFDIQSCETDAVSNHNNNRNKISLTNDESATLSTINQTEVLLESHVQLLTTRESSGVLSQSRRRHRRRRRSSDVATAINIDEEQQQHEAVVAALSLSEPELSDTESAHHSMSMSSPEDGPAQQESERVHGRDSCDDGTSAEDDDEDDDDDESASECESSRKVLPVTFPLATIAVKEEDRSTSSPDHPMLKVNVSDEDVIASSSSSSSLAPTLLLVELTRGREESDQEYARRVRKQNYLSLAQEFVDRKAAVVAMLKEDETVQVSSINCEDDHVLERSKNVRNCEKSFDTRVDATTTTTTTTTTTKEQQQPPPPTPPDYCLVEPVSTVVDRDQMGTVNQNAIHDHHQRSLVSRRSLLNPPTMQLMEPLITSPKHVCIPRRISFKMPYVDDLPANVAKMAAVKSVINGPPANAAFQRSARPVSVVGAQQTMKCADSRQANRSSRSRRHTYQYDTIGGGALHCAMSTAFSSASNSRNVGVLTTTTTASTTTATQPIYSSDDVVIGRFDVYNIETTMPTIDWVAMEEHLTKAAKEERDIFHKHHRNNNREEIRRKLAMGSDNDDYYGGERTSAGRKPSLQTRLQSGMNLQICFMNETVGEQESTTQSAVEQSTTLSSRTTMGARPMLATGKSSEVLASSATVQDSPSSSSTVANQKLSVGTGGFVSRQAKLQAEARMALAQAKQMAHMQMEVEKQRKKKSPIAEMVGIPFPDGRRKVSRHALCEMNVAQLQVIVNDLHSQIESLNEDLVRMLLDRDDLHMEQDSMLVDIEDLTRYVGAKDQAHRDDQCGDAGVGCKPPSSSPPPLSRPKTKKSFLVK